MNKIQRIKTIREIIWGANRPAHPRGPSYTQLELGLDCRQYCREDLQLLDSLRQIRADLARD